MAKNYEEVAMQFAYARSEPYLPHLVLPQYDADDYEQLL